MRAIVPELVILMVLFLVAGLALVAAGMGQRAGALSWRQLMRLRREMRRDDQTRRARRDTPWRMYSRPALDKPVYRVGVERRWQGKVFGRQEMAVVPEEDITGRLQAEGAAIMKAQELTEARVGMDDEATE